MMPFPRINLTSNEPLSAHVQPATNIPRMSISLTDPFRAFLEQMNKLLSFLARFLDLMDTRCCLSLRFSCFLLV